MTNSFSAVVLTWWHLFMWLFRGLRSWQSPGWRNHCVHHQPVLLCLILCSIRGTSIAVGKCASNLWWWLEHLYLFPVLPLHSACASLFSDFLPLLLFVLFIHFHFTLHWCSFSGWSSSLNVNFPPGLSNLF